MAEILFIDDDPAIIGQLTQLIETLGHVPHGSLYPDHLSEILSHVSPDLILLDVHMPQIDGLTLLGQLKTDDTHRELPVIMLTGDATEDTLVACFEAGAFDYILKPIQETSLRARLGAALAVREHMQKLARARDQLKSIFDAMEEGIVTLDANYRVTMVSRKACVMLDDDESALLHKGAAAVLGAPIAGPRGLLVEARDQPIDSHSTRLLCPSGAVVPVNVSIRKLDETISNAAWMVSLHDNREAERVAVANRAGYRFGAMISNDEAMHEVFRFIDKVASGSSTVLVRGESGTGKELVAREIHDRSHRAQRPFVPVNCGAVPENLLESAFFGHERGAFTGAVSAQAGYFEAANGGTLFLDEIGELPLPLQAKLLRVLQDGLVTRVGSSRQLRLDVRIVAATHRDLETMVTEGSFRQDLFYRLDVLTIQLPPLRERPADIPLLAGLFIEQRNRREKSKLSSPKAETLEALLGYAWPGNVRELFNALERACALAEGEQLSFEHLPKRVRQDTGKTPVEDEKRETLSEKDAILKALETCGYHKGKAAALLGISPPTLYRKRKKYGI